MRDVSLHALAIVLAQQHAMSRSIRRNDSMAIPVHALEPQCQCWGCTSAAMLCAVKLCRTTQHNPVGYVELASDDVPPLRHQDGAGPPDRGNSIHESLAVVCDTITNGPKILQQAGRVGGWGVACKARDVVHVAMGTFDRSQT